MDEGLEENKKGKEFGAKGGAAFVAALEKAQSWARKYPTADEIPDNKIPDSYDFRDVDGFDFTNPLRD